MEWSDEGIVLAVRRHGEAAAIASLLTRAHGRHAGLVHGGAGRRARGVLQPGNLVAARWRARVAENLGNFTCELERAHAAECLDDRLRLAALSAACAMAEATLPEREPHGAVFASLEALLAALAGADWLRRYVRWELDLLRELGFGLDLATCAATGRNDQLAYVSPRTGRAVSLAAGARWRNALLPLPAFLVDDALAGKAEIEDGLRLTGHFLDLHVFSAHHRPPPAARRRLVALVGKTVPPPAAAEPARRPGPD